MATAFAVVTGDPLTGEVAGVHAQIGPSPIPQPGGPGQTTKPAGVAEQAKDEADKLPTTPVLPQDKSKRKRFELFELDGYYRFRTDWFKNFNMNFSTVAPGGSPFPQSLACQAQTLDSADSSLELLDNDIDCGETLKSANMRLRLEPTINVDETTHVYLQIDVLDNVVLGSNPDTLAFQDPDGSFDGQVGGQAPPEAGRNGFTDSIRIRRAWAEIETSLGQLSFGRMPWHWGMGIYANAGGSNPFSNTYDTDSDYGDTVDRLMFRFQVPGTRIDAAIAMDWSATSPSAGQSGVFSDRYDGQPWDLEDSDDVNQWVIMLTRYDKPKVFDELVAKGELGINAGGFLAYRTQDAATSFGADGVDPAVHRRGLRTYTLDGWFKLGTGKLTVEGEAIGTVGSIDEVDDIALDPPVEGSVDIRSFGGAARVNYRALEDKMNIGVELGFASGDQWDNERDGETHVRNARRLPIGGSDRTISNFYFDFDYDIDLILFRELLGTITNATYIKPHVTYELTSEFLLKARGIISFANVPVSTPGNDTMYGFELNGDLGYHKGGFFAGISYGVLFPLGAMDHPAALSAVYNPIDPSEPTGLLNNLGDAGNAQTIQTRLMLRF